MIARSACQIGRSGGVPRDCFISSPPCKDLFFAVLAVSGIIWMSQSLRFVDLVLNRGLPAYNMFYLAFLVLPMFTSVFLPIVLFGVVVFAYTKMNQDSELVVWRGCGKGPISVAAPALAAATLVMALCYLVNLYSMPAAYREFKDLQLSIRDNYSEILLREGVFNEVGPNLTVYVRERAANGELLGLLVYDRGKDGTPVTMMAERGALVRTDLGPRVVMVKGNRQTLKKDEDKLSILFFDRYTLDLGTPTTDSKERWHQPRERYIHQLFSIKKTGRYGASDWKQRLKFYAEGHQRIATPWLAMAFALMALAALLTGDFNRRGLALRITMVTSAMLIVQSLSVMLYHLAGNSMAAVPFMYLLPAAAIGVSLWLLIRPKRRHGSRPLDIGEADQTEGIGEADQTRDNGGPDPAKANP
jgi:lipopolysaccharide export system permease protein